MRRLAQFVRLRLSRVCVHLSRVRLASACICLACVSRLSASVHVKGSECVRLLASVCVGRLVSRLSRICLASVSRLSRICLASVSRLRRSRVCVHLSRVCLASVVLSHVCLASVVLSRVCLSVLVNACGNWLILCVGRHSKSSKGFLLSSYYRCTYRLCRLYEQTFNILI